MRGRMTLGMLLMAALAIGCAGNRKATTQSALSKQEKQRMADAREAAKRQEKAREQEAAAEKKRAQAEREAQAKAEKQRKEEAQAAAKREAKAREEQAKAERERMAAAEKRQAEEQKQAAEAKRREAEVARREAEAAAKAQREKEALALSAEKREAARLSAQQREQAKLDKEQAKRDAKAAKAQAKRDAKLRREQDKLEEKERKELEKQEKKRASDRKHELGHEMMMHEDEPRLFDAITQLQAASGARDDAGFSDAHFDGGQLNALGQSKLALILQSAAKDQPVTIYVGGAKGDVQGRLAALEQYWKDSDYAQVQLQLKEGSNMEMTTPASIGIRGLEKMERQRQMAPRSGSFGNGTGTNGSTSATPRM